MISQDIHILTDDDLQSIKREAEQKGWRDCRKWHLEAIKHLQSIERDNALSNVTADPDDMDVWLADMNR